MLTNKFSKKEALSFGWKTMKDNFWFFFGILLIVGLVNLFPEIVKASLEIIKAFLLNQRLPIPVTVVIGVNLIRLILPIISWVLGIILGMGLIKICLKFYDQQKPKFSALFSQYPLFFKMLFGSILYGLITLLGTILLIIPGIIFAIKFYLFEYFIVDKGLGPIEALKRSWRITKGTGWNLFLFFLLVGFINFLGALCLLVGLFATIPTTMLATAFVYRKLLSQIEINQTYVQR